MTVKWGGRGPGHTSRITFPGEFVGGGEPPEAEAGATAPVLANLESGWTSGDNPPSWKSTYSNVIAYIAGTGHQVRAVWTFAGGSAVTEDWKNLDEEALVNGFSWPLLAAADLTAGGSFSVYEEMRYVEDDVQLAISDASNTWSDTLDAGGSVEDASAWVTTTGVNKSQYVTVSGTGNLVATGTDGFNGTPVSVRADQARTGKRQWQVTTGAAWSAGAGYIGVDDGTTDFNTGYVRPGKHNSAGVSLAFFPTGWEIYSGGGLVQSNYSSANAANDIITMAFDQAGGTVSFYRTRSGTTVQLGTTVTGLSFTAWYANCGFENNFSLTALFGSGQARALDVDYGPYDNI